MHRTGSRAASAMKMRNEYASHHGIQHYLIVEGESDEHFFENLLDCKKCKVMNLDGKSNVINFIKDQNCRHNKGYLGVVDADFGNIDGNEEIDNLIYTDTHDMEMLILSSNPNMRRMYSELSENILIQSFEDKHEKTFISAVIAAAYDIGCLKHAVQKRKYNNMINMKELPYIDIVSDSFTVNIDELIRRIKMRFTATEIKQDFENEKASNIEVWQMACGHDVTEILTIAFTSTEYEGLGFGKNKRLTKERIEGILRVIYDINHFLSTKLYKKIVEWEIKNSIQIIDRVVLAA